MMRVREEQVFEIVLYGEIVGYIRYFVSDYYLYLTDLQLYPFWVRRGVGRAVLFYLHRFVKNNGHVGIRLKVFKDNPARWFYETFGFVCVEDEGYLCKYQWIIKIDKGHE